MPRPANTQARRQQIVKAMIDVMAANGYGGATIPLIAKKAGLLPGLVLYHFENKQSILIALLEQLVSLVHKRFEARKNENALDNLNAYIDAHLAYGTDAAPSAVSCWLTLNAEAVHQEEVKEALQSVTEEKILFLESLCETALKADGRKTSKKREIALGIYAAIEGSFNLVVVAPHLIAPGFAAPTVQAMAKGLISAQPLATSNKRRT